MQCTLLPVKINDSWLDFLDSEIIEELNEISQRIGENVNPDADNILRFLRTDLSKMKVVILGQDPYPEKGVATGRAFEVGGLKSWDQPFRQVSLKNIIRLLYKSYNNITRYEDILSFEQIKNEIREGRFPLFPPDRLFSSWEKQGVLLLNTSFSCTPDNPGSHSQLWQNFSCRLIEYISENFDLYWFLWGKHAYSMKPLIAKGNFFISRHPMLCSSKYEDDFLKSDCFLRTKDLINWLGTA